MTIEKIERLSGSYSQNESIFMRKINEMIDVINGIEQRLNQSAEIVSTFIKENQIDTEE